MKKAIILVIVVIVAIASYVIYQKYAGGSKYDFRPTMLSIVDFEDIGTLYVAKYFGEVIAATTDAAQKRNETVLKEITNFIEELKNIDLPESNTQTQSRQLANQVLKNKYETDDISKIVNKNRAVKCFLKGYFNGTRNSAEMFSASETFKKVVKKVVEEQSDLPEEVMEEIANVVYRSNPQIKGGLAYLARGSVSIGFDLKELKDNDIKIEKRNGRTILKIMPALIVRCVINPMFLVKNRKENNPEIIKGYELIRGESMRFEESTFKQMQEVKRQCKMSLVKAALEDNLIQKSIENGDRVLKGFLSLFKYMDVNRQKVSTETLDALEIDVLTNKVKYFPEYLKNIKVRIVNKHNEFENLEGHFKRINQRIKKRRVSENKL